MWKNVKEHYRIGHAVCVADKGICIGSPYIHDLIIIGLDGKISKPYRDGKGVNEDLNRYMVEMEADPAKLCELVTTPDTFDKSLPVYTYDGGNIIEKRCEKYDWPNVTHDGDMMYENTYSKTKSKVVKWAKSNAESGIKWQSERIEELKREIAKIEAHLAQSKADRAKLEVDYPEKSNAELSGQPPKT